MALSVSLPEGGSSREQKHLSISKAIDEVAALRDKIRTLRDRIQNVPPPGIPEEPCPEASSPPAPGLALVLATSPERLGAYCKEINETLEEIQNDLF